MDFGHSYNITFGHCVDVLFSADNNREKQWQLYPMWGWGFVNFSTHRCLVSQSFWMWQWERRGTHSSMFVFICWRFARPFLDELKVLFTPPAIIMYFDAQKSHWMRLRNKYTLLWLMRSVHRIVASCPSQILLCNRFHISFENLFACRGKFPDSHG